jgi:hypothetical protein
MSGGSFCANLAPQPSLKLCSDFDEATDPLGAWMVSGSDGDAGFGVVDAESFSAPNSLLAEVPPLASNGSAYAGLLYSFSFSSSVRVEFEYLATMDTDDKIAEFVFPSEYAVGLVLSTTVPVQTIPIQETIPTDGGVNYIMPAASSSPCPAPLMGRWIAMSLTVSAPDDGGAATATVQIGSTSCTAALVGPGSAFASSDDAGSPGVLLRFGAVFVNQSQHGWSANFDNVVVYAQ